MTIIKLDYEARRRLEQLAGLDGSADTELYCFRAAQPNCNRCENTRRVGYSAFPLPCPDCTSGDLKNT